MNKEFGNQELLSKMQNVCLVMSVKAMLWLTNCTLDRKGGIIPNWLLFYDLMARMRTESGCNESFRRSLELEPGMLQFSEELLADDWNVGRWQVRFILAKMKELRLIDYMSSRIASTIALRSLYSWVDMSGNEVINQSIDADFSGCGIANNGDCSGDSETRN